MLLWFFTLLLQDDLHTKFVPLHGQQQILDKTKKITNTKGQHLVHQAKSNSKH